MPVLPRWVTQLAVWLLLIAGVAKTLADLLPTFPLPWTPTVTVYLALFAGVLAALGKALGDTDGDGIPNVIDPD